MPSYDTLIIGAGMSGLAAGIRLAHFDRRVCILERHTTIGGLNSFYRQNGRNIDVGLHAVTNFTPRGAKTGPLAKLLRQLRLSWDELGLVPQLSSSVVFPGTRLRFNNDFDFFRSEVHREFPGEKDGFERLVASLAGYDDLELDRGGQSARAILASFLKEQRLIEMILCPVMYYGNARENDMDWGQFCIMFRAIFLEGFARPLSGIRVLLKTLVRKFKTLGGELRLRAGVARIEIERGRAQRVILDNGETIEAHNVLSSAGWLETMRMCDDVSQADVASAGQLSFVECISVLDRQPREVGFDQSVLFFNHTDRFQWRKPEGLVDVDSGVVCSPNNYAYDTLLPDAMIRVNCLANYDLWRALPEEQYRLEKLRWYDRMVATVVKFLPDFRRAVIDTDTFTPTTIRRFTGHVNGAVYGAPDKRYDGRTHLENVFLCGTDQGFVGIIGAITSGILIANRHLLRPS